MVKGSIVVAITPNQEPLTRVISVDGFAVPGDGRKAVEVPVGRHEVMFEIDLGTATPRFVASIFFNAGTVYQTRFVVLSGRNYGQLEEVGPYGYDTGGYIYVYSGKRPQSYMTAVGTRVRE